MRTEGFPRVFGPFLLLSSLGRGGMGEVFLAKRHAVGDVDRLCIVKTLRADLAEHGEYVRRFLDEARVVVQLSHPHICQVFESTRVASEFCLAMEYLAGNNLKDLAADLANRSQRLDEGLALYVISCVLDALAFAHRFKSPTTGVHLKVIHRDVSPANVMVTFEGDVKLIDFGLAESTLKTEETETRLVMGKVAYMAPEQARGDEIDGAVDQFAAAVMLYELLTGDRFYGGMNTHQIWQRVGHGGHLPARLGEVSEPLRAVLTRALQSRPADRFPSCDAMRDVLDELRARNHPRANKGQLRELMLRINGDRADAERDLIASFQDLRAPGSPGAHAPVPELSASNRLHVAVSSASSGSARGTEPWRNSPSSSDLPLSPVASIGAAPGVVEASVTERLDAPSLPLASASPVEESYALPRATPGLVRIGASVLALVAFGALVFVIGGGFDASPQPERVDAVASAVVAASGASVAGNIEPASSLPTPAALAVDAGAVVDHSVPAQAVEGHAPRAPRPKNPTRATADAGEARAPEAPPVALLAPDAGAMAAVPRTLVQDWEIVRACSRECAKEIIPLVDAAQGNLEAKAVLIRHCARKCVEPNR